ncbi:Flagellar hook-associated protein FliD [Devosia sp. LC5]|uniref:flagellin N-terminal helical domain-containing protein n=1 Tax=Devosia sp. LC5 TaxID=1502724 RepID=UPI0004E2AA66|nr:flagellin [Devosia sp. LC5]KFC69116.1 Flagellar hook-associated protein FliD [Devosia sp. LC5]
MADINLTASVRSNLTSLQNTATMMAKTQDRLSTGNKVNSALDNPTNFFTAASLNSRAGDLNNLMDSMANGIKTIEAANNGLTSITKNLESMQSTLRQARQDKSFQTQSYTIDSTVTTGDISFEKGAVGDVARSVSLVKTEKTSALTGPVALADNGKTFTIDTGAGAPTADITLATGDTATDIANKINTATAAVGNGVTAKVENGQIKLSHATATAAITVADGAAPAGGAAVLGFGADTNVAKSTDELVSEINKNTDLEGFVRASNDNGKLRIENLSTQTLEVTQGTTASEIAGNAVRADLANQFNELRDQLDKLSDDASFNGINLLRGDKLKITFNETGTSSIDIQSKGEDAVNAANLKLSTTLTAKDLDSDAGIDAFLDQVKGALNSVRSQASSFGSNLSIVQNRQDFTKSMINTLETGAGNLTLADMNQEAANMMALQTRQSLGTSTLSMANQADQSILQLLR